MGGPSYSKHQNQHFKKRPPWPELMSPVHLQCVQWARMYISVSVHVFFFLHVLRRYLSVYAKAHLSRNSCIWTFIHGVCESISAQGRGHQTSHRGTELGEECSGTSLKLLTKEQRCGCVQVWVLRGCVCVCVRRFPSGALEGDSH